MISSISAVDISETFNLKVSGKTSVLIDTVGSFKKQNRSAILWAKNHENLTKIKTGYIVVSSDLELPHPTDDITYLITDQKPRLIFAKIISEFFSHLVSENLINDIDIHRRNNKIVIGDNVFIGKNVEIGDGTVIHPNVVIYPRTRIGKNCIIGTHVSIGTEGLGLEMNSDTGTYIKFPQLGGVVIEDDVEIGPTSTVRRSALDDTIIKRGTKIGSLVNIGHNCIVGENCILTCQVVMAGSSVLGNNVFMGVNSTVKNGVNIGSNATIGQGTVVTKNVPDGSTYIGNPAEDINKYKSWSQLKKYLSQLFADKI